MTILEKLYSIMQDLKRISDYYHLGLKIEEGKHG